MQISPNFKRGEFACRCKCGFDTVDIELIKILEKVRSHFDAPIKINSGARCIDHNRAIGGSDASQHTKGRAADIVVKGVSSMDVHAYLDDRYPTALGLGYYPNFTHIDTRSGHARWS